MDWTGWKRHFEANSVRPLPELGGAPFACEGELRWALADSLAKFQLGESGEGRIAHQIDRVHLSGIDDDYRAALKRFVAEEGRHARILAMLVKGLGGTLLRKSWTERLFVHGRRLAGVRLKLLVLLAAEVVGIGFYEAVCGKLPDSALRRALLEICADEEAHLRFHEDFFRAECVSGWKRALFHLVFGFVCVVAAALVCHDHRRALRALDIPRIGLFRSYVRLIAQVRLEARLDHPMRAPAKVSGA